MALVTGRPPIRHATSDDAAELARLISPLGYPISGEDVAALWEAWEEGGGFALVAEGGDSLLGVITLQSVLVLHRPRPVGRITSLLVDAPARGRGLGRALVDAAEEALREKGCGLVEVTSHMRRSEAHTFYEHVSYDRTSFRFAKRLD